ncbi:hypothetical protein LH51_04735 [Nitrincola sp. A-D6]|uniref:hypothetical protein n=1 Tax=Nitrincola sp. A-D6 TaxID=1545442 RepID=UPI00051FF2F8|nr:hypothetical protein [Nitrincola sp. A-D6]KGK42722.1 hypothetical protein LH51_04735 [Nitrincola sp. A-D6]
MQQLSRYSPALVAIDRLWLARQGENREVLMTTDIRICFVGDSFVNGTGDEEAAQSVPYIDIFSSLVSEDSYKLEVMSNDGSHPGSSSYVKMAQIISSSPNWRFYAP